MLFRAMFLAIFVGLAGCAMTVQPFPDDFAYVPVHAGDFDILTYQKISDPRAPVRVYIEGDGHAFDSMGKPTDNPTPHGDTVRRMAMRDGAANVVYMARPCQYIMSDTCTVSDWTSGRFSSRIVSAMRDAVHQVAGNREIVLIGYSGGALLSGLIIMQNPDMNVTQWITVAGVLNHDDWTRYFGDTPLSDSMDMDELPHVSQLHYVASYDTVVPQHLSKQWTHDKIIIVPNTRHDNLGDFVPSHHCKD